MGPLETSKIWQFLRNRFTRNVRRGRGLYIVVFNAPRAIFSVVRDIHTPDSRERKFAIHLLCQSIRGLERSLNPGNWKRLLTHGLADGEEVGGEILLARYIGRDGVGIVKQRSASGNHLHGEVASEVSGRL